MRTEDRCEATRSMPPSSDTLECPHLSRPVFHFQRRAEHVARAWRSTWGLPGDVRFFDAKSPWSALWHCFSRRPVLSKGTSAAHPPICELFLLRVDRGPRPAPLRHAGRSSSRCSRPNSVSHVLVEVSVEGTMFVGTLKNGLSLSLSALRE